MTTKQLWSYSRAGKMHEKNNILCEDFSSAGTKNNMSYIVVADGAGSLKNCREGAKCAANAIVEYVSQNFDRLFTEDIKRLKFFIADHVVYSIKKIANGRDIKSFGSTLVFMGIKEGRFIMFHLGDGAILAGQHDSYRVMSLPMNGQSDRHTFLTTTAGAHSFARVNRGIVRDNCYTAMTDGCYKLFTDRKTGLPAWESIIAHSSPETIKQLMHSRREYDDDFSLSTIVIKDMEAS